MLLLYNISNIQIKLKHSVFFNLNRYYQTVKDNYYGKIFKPSMV
ncbi:hypothetical protein AO382_0168 [Moraxella catarrhalis]|uniref:Uncharacterized protein n=1 Tax=Moraxella catarrhalis TaxID=480 RepID=A0A7Z1A4H4_MORCA|nr:hypothetical protein AO382_0168 [Moraxella catarrhalis]